MEVPLCKEFVPPKFGGCYVLRSADAVGVMRIFKHHNKSGASSIRSVWTLQGYLAQKKYSPSRTLLKD